MSLFAIVVVWTILSAFFIAVTTPERFYNFETNASKFGKIAFYFFNSVGMLFWIISISFVVIVMTIAHNLFRLYKKVKRGVRR